MCSWMESCPPTVTRLWCGADFKRGGKTLDETYDVLGMRIVLEGPNGAPLPEAKGREACYAVERTVSTLWRVIPSRRKDYIAEPKDNGYQSLHLAVEVPDGARVTAGAAAGAARGGSVTTVEVQVRTGTMHASAEEGVAAHVSYKSGMDVQQSTRLHEWTQELMQACSPPRLPLSAAPGVPEGLRMQLQQCCVYLAVATCTATAGGVQFCPCRWHTANLGRNVCSVLQQCVFPPVGQANGMV